VPGRRLLERRTAGVARPADVGPATEVLLAGELAPGVGEIQFVEGGILVGEGAQSAEAEGTGEDDGQPDDGDDQEKDQNEAHDGPPEGKAEAYAENEGVTDCELTLPH
jgi:hypothetical protein